MSEEFTKADAMKPRYSLIPPEALLALAKLYAQGAVKYSDRNWELGTDWSRYYDALQRHANSWWAGENYDEEGQHHLAAVIWCAMALYTYDVRQIGTDDRPTGVLRDVPDRSG